MSEHDDNRRDDLSARDAELAQRIAQTLDASADAFDSDTREQLMMMRHRALMRTRKRHLAMAVAASVLALAAAPWILRQQAHEQIADDGAYLSVEPEMLSDMDMLLAIGEPQ